MVTQYQEDYIWAMRMSNENNEIARSQNIEHSVKKNVSELRVSDEQSKIMATLVPDEVIYNVKDYNHKQHNVCFLFGDVSGFTELCEKYTATGVSGPSRLTQVLNKYLGSMVQEVISHNGDVLKFSGDAFLAIFKVTESRSMREAVHEAIDCALVIQKTYGSYYTDVDVVIRVKLAISAGLVTFALIGDETMSHYVIVGTPIWEVKTAEGISTAGDIIITPSAWQHMSLNEYIYQRLPDQIHVKIIGLGPNWHSVQRHDAQQHADVDIDETDNLSFDDDFSDLSVAADAAETEEDFMHSEGVKTSFAVRPAVNVAAKKNMKESLRRFIITPVMKSIDRNESFEYLTEMRQVAIVFINVISKSLETEKAVTLADEAYKIVCRVVDRENGCVNKVSFFDKDLMFVVVFGLRGLKHELECQAALRCAKECHKAIGKLENTASTSVGVTTGKTYCGVFGHPLRREYTVISLIVNKAARLMMNYKGKVTCDKETFLNSKLEARHFILQEFVHLKGISRPGPVYEYVEFDTTEVEVTRVRRKYPILGRSNNLREYDRVLEACYKASSLTQQECKMLIITGEARLGKTRLLDEFIFNTPRDIKVVKISMSRMDPNVGKVLRLDRVVCVKFCKYIPRAERELRPWTSWSNVFFSPLIPFETLRKLFFNPFMVNSSEIEKKKTKLFKILKNLKRSDLTEALGAVHFPRWGSYRATTNKAEQQKVARDIIAYLIYMCFSSFLVLAIDNCEFIDEQSWQIFDLFFRLEKVFIVATMIPNKINQSNAAAKILQHPKVKMSKLRPIDRFYMGALTCQLLEVVGLPPELENILHTRSNGNPGWIESFLITLLQDKALFIITATLREINDLGLVCPPLYLMAKLNKNQKQMWQKVMEEKKSTQDSDDTHIWSKYVDTCRNSYLNVTIRGKMESIKPDEKLPICILSSSFSIPDDLMELSVDTMAMIAFDNLTHFERYLVKCGSVLGHQFLREMLVYVALVQDETKTSLAIKKLFEMRVLSCAKGDFLEVEDSSFVKERTRDPNESYLKCYCRGITKRDKAVQGIPLFASCAYLQFCSASICEITYNLLTDNQKKEFHLRAIAYLERSTRKCRACGGGFFDNIMGFKQDMDLLNLKHGDSKFGGWDNDASVNLSASRRFSTGGRESLSAAPSYILRSYSSTYRFPSLNIDDINKDYLGFQLIRKVKNDPAFARSFLRHDFSDCECSIILSSTFSKLIEHCAKAGDLLKQIEAILEYSRICVILQNVPMALTALDEALNVLARKSLEPMPNRWKLNLIHARIYILIGYARREIGDLQTAHNYLHKALGVYGIKFTSGVRTFFRTRYMELVRFFDLYFYPKMKSTNMTHWESVYANSLAECLLHLCQVYMAMGRWKDAENAATWGLNQALSAFADYELICLCFANLIQVSKHFGNVTLCVALEVHALKCCHYKSEHLIDFDDLRSVCTLYKAIFESCLYRMDIDRSIFMGYSVLRIGSAVRACNLILAIWPNLMQLLLIRKQYNNAYSIITEYKFLCEENTLSPAKTWYHALSICLQLETGYVSVSYANCEKFYHYEGEGWFAGQEPDAKKRFLIVMWLWCIRNEQYQAATCWCNNLKEFFSTSVKDTMTTKITCLYVLEGMLLLYVCQLDKRNVEPAIDMLKDIQKLFNVIWKCSHNCKLILPRYYHLAAYFAFIKNDESNLAKYVAKATEIAEKQSNKHELAWIEHSQKAWNRTLTTSDLFCWREHAEADDNLNLAILEENPEKSCYFTLPTPFYL